MILNIIIINIIGLFSACNFARANKFVYQVKMFNLRNKTSQSSENRNKGPSLAVDGNINTCSFAKSDPNKNDYLWWRIELDRLYDITHVRILQDKKKQNSIFVTEYNAFISRRIDEPLQCASYKNTFLTFTDGYFDFNCTKSINGQIVTLNTLGKSITLCEVKIFADLRTVNLAYNRPLIQQGTLLKDTSHLSVDGDPLTCGVMKTKVKELPWFRVVLDKIHYVTDVMFSFKPLYFFTDQRYLDRNVRIFVSENDENYEEKLCLETTEIENKDSKELSLSLNCTRPTPGRFVTLQKYKGEYPDILVICEMEIYSRRVPHKMRNKTSPSCLQDEYKCTRGDCIHKDWLCDGTNDCPLADDEAPSCRGGKGRFKCKRINETVSIQERCDGIWNCPDYSDEEHCFDLHGDHLTATFQGKSNFYICSDNWNVKYSADICEKYNRDYNATNHISIRDSKKFLIINKTRSSSNSINLMELFDKSNVCHSKKIVNLKCAYKRDWNYSCGKRDLPDALLEPYEMKEQNIQIGTWPWYAQIYVGREFYKKAYCSGSLIHKDWVLTAAHCFDSEANLGEIYVKFDSNIYNDFDNEEYYISHLITHPSYDKLALDNGYNIALLRLKLKASYFKYIRPICLPDKVIDVRALMSFQYCVVAGFGDFNKDDLDPMFKRQAKMSFAPKGSCSVDNFDGSLYYKLHFYKNFCPGQRMLTNDSNVCKGDVGSPWMCKSKDGSWTQVGVAQSYYVVNDQICTKSIFLFVGDYLDFIYSVMKKKYASVYEQIWEI